MARILIVEDDSDKLGHIVRVLRTVEGFSDDNVESVVDVVEAKRRLQATAFTLLILDIALPIRIGDDVRPEAGIELLNEIFDDRGLKPPRHIVGLTAHDDIVERAEQVFASSALTVLHFDVASGAWADTLRTLGRHIVASEAVSLELGAYQSFLGVICALQSPEFSAILRLPWSWQPSPRSDDTTTYYEGVVTSGVDAPLRRVVAACANRKGMPAASIVTSKLIALYRPEYLAMAGITAGIAGRANLGDVIAAEVCWDWGSGKWTTRKSNPIFQASPWQVAVSAEIREKLNRLASDTELIAEVERAWPGRKPPTRLAVRIGPVASGASVLSDAKALERIQNQHRDLVGVEMEVYGVFLASENGLLPRPKYFALKSAVDFGDSAKNDDYQDYGAFTSAELLRRFVETYLLNVVRLPLK